MLNTRCPKKMHVSEVISFSLTGVFLKIEVTFAQNQPIFEFGIVLYIYLKC